MALETGTYTNDLVTSNPSAADGLNQGDDHIRLLKATLKNTFAGFTSAPLNSSQAQLDAAVASVTGSSYTLFKAGTAALPGLTPIGDTDSGLWAPAANQVALAVGGVSILNVSSTGVGVTGNVVASGGVAAAAIASTGAFSGGTGQLVPIGGMILWLEDTLPAEGGYCWANGGTLSRAANPLLWARWGTKYGVGDGSTTFNVKNMCEVVPVGQRAMGGASTRALLATGVLGSADIGAATVALGTGNLPPYTPTGIVTNGAITGGAAGGATGALGGSAGAVAVGVDNQAAGYAFARLGIVQAASTFAGTAQGGSSSPFGIVQPTAAVNYIIRIG